jgi:hypothetical protein
MGGWELAVMLMIARMIVSVCFMVARYVIQRYALSFGCAVIQ